MSSMKNIGVREFRDHATKYLAGPEPVAVNRHGKVIGFYIPLRRDEDEVRQAVAQLGKAVEQVIDETGIGEDELASIFDTRRPFPG
jgi:antitoxin (DNA-binding transcriptional repressor) of toxin-antitoxin stability system